MSLLRIDGLSVAIRGAPILDRVSLSVAPGEILALIGESGSGKSMTALSVMGLLPEGAEATGRVIFEGADLLALPDRALCRLRGRRIGMVFQEPMTALNPLRTIGDQVAEVIALHGMDRGRAALAKAREILSRVGLAEARFPASRYPHELSGGQRQRVVIAMAVACRPALLIADEPTTALDVTTQAGILDLIRQLVAEDGMGCLFVSHDLAVVQGLADRLVIMRHGAVVETGETRAVLAAQRHAYTRALIAASRHQPDKVGAGGGPPLLEVHQVVRRYPGPRQGLLARSAPVTAVDGVSFTLAPGESLGVVGASGCGKSTLARAILGLEPVQGGAITLDGAPIDAHRPLPRDIRAKMQVVFQDPYGSFNPRHHVSRLVSEPFHLRADAPKGRARARAVAEALEAVGLSARDGEKYPHEFSGGQRQRIAIARALIIRPKLIVLDEAVSALDVQVRAQILDLMAALRRRFGLAYLFISHDLHVVRAVTDRVLVMEAGRVVEEGATEAVLATPRHSVTQALVRAAPILDLPEPARA